MKELSAFRTTGGGKTSITSAVCHCNYANTAPFGRGRRRAGGVALLIHLCIYEQGPFISEEIKAVSESLKYVLNKVRSVSGLS